MTGNEIVAKPLPVKRRRTFGGPNGVWWMQRARSKPKSLETQGSESSPEDVSKDGSPKQSTPNGGEIEWDEDLCRPIYRRKTPPKSCDGSLIVTDENGFSDESSESFSLIDDSSPTPSSPTSSRPPNNIDSITKRLWIKAPVKRKKSFGTRKRPYSFLLHESSSSSSSSASSSPSISQEDDNKSNVSTASTTLSFSEATRVEPTKTNNNATKKPKKRRRVLQKDEATLLKAKKFFEQLDATQRLTVVDCSATPLNHNGSDNSNQHCSSSKITRTSHKLNLQSPRIQKEYQAYAQASKESGLSPLCLKTYAANRRDFFRKRELFDGFLDD